MNDSRIRNWVTLSATLFVLLFIAVPFATAQVTTGNLQGVVVDPNKAVVAGATVKVTNAETGISRETTTSAEGFYRVTNLIPGDRYTVEVTAAGFAPTTQENVAVRLASENTADIAVGIAQVTGEVINVTEGNQLIQSTQSQLSQQYTSRQLTQLPFVGSIDNLALLTPGVVTPGDADFANGVGISANGNRGRSNNFQIDGQDNNDNSVAGPALTITNAEAIGDYQVITNSFSAEFGRNSGAQVNTITKSGTNNIHGTLFEFLRNSRLNALNNSEKTQLQTFRFLNDNGVAGFAGLANRNKPGLFRENRFGGSIGGPIIKNKAFFFATYQRTPFRGDALSSGFGGGSFTPNLDSAQSAGRLFPNAATGALTSTAVAGGPATAQGVGSFLVLPPTQDTNGDGIPDTFLFPNTPGRLAPLAIIADPTAPGGRRTIFGGEGFRQRPSRADNDQFITREDINLTNKDVIVARYIFDRSGNPLAVGRTLAGALFDVPSRNNNIGVSYTRQLSSRSVNEARFNFSRLDVKFGDPSGTLPGPGISFGGTRSIAGGSLLTFGTQNNLPQSRKVDVYQEQDTVTATLGNNALKFGVDLRQQKVNNFFLPNFLGTFTFNSGGTALPANTFFNTSGTARTSPTAFENFLLGRPRQINFALGNPNIKTTQNDFFFFVQDDYRVRPNLTLNLGFRYELSTTPFNPIIERLNAREADPSTAIFDPSFDISTRSAQRLRLDKNNFSPRVGFAYTPNFKFLGDRFTNGRTVIRGGYGIAYDPSFFNIVLNTVTAAPFAASGTVIQTPGAAGSLAFPSLPTTTAQLNTTPGTNGGDPRLFNQTRVSSDFYNPYTQSYNFGIQQELFKNGVLEARFVGSRIVGQFQTVNANPDLRGFARAGQFLFSDPGRFTGGLISPGATVANNFESRLGTNGSGRADPTSGPVRLRSNGASSTYNGLQVRFDTRLRNQFTINANYTLSKTIDNASEIFGTLGGGQSIAVAQNPFNISRGERALSAFHQKHNFTTNFLVDLPFFKEQQGFVGKLLGGFQVNGLIRAGSGRPYTPVELFGRGDNSFEGTFTNGALRPFNGNSSAPNGTIAFGTTAACGILFGGPECDTAQPGQFIIFNTLSPGSIGTVVSAQQALQGARLIYNDFGLAQTFGVPLASLEAFNLFKTPFGDVGRNTFSGLPFYTANLSLFKTTKISESKRLELRAEAFNIFNHRNFGVPDAITEDASNGFTVSTFQNPGGNTGSRRTIRFGVRFIF